MRHRLCNDWGQRHQQLISFALGVTVTLHTQIDRTRGNGHFADGFVLVNHHDFLVRNVFRARDVVANCVHVVAISAAEAVAHTGGHMYGALARRDGGPPVGLVHWLRQPTCGDVHDSCYLQELSVDPALRSGGVGGALIAHVVADAAGFGAAQVRWLTHETNAQARSLYDRVATLSGFVDYRIPIPR